MRPVPTRRTALVALLVAVVVLAAPERRRAAPRSLLANLALLVRRPARRGAGGRPAAARDRARPPAGARAARHRRAHLAVRNPTDRTLRVALADELAPSLRASTRRLRGTVPGGATLAHDRRRCDPSRRGRFEIGGLVVRVEGPLGHRRAPAPAPGRRPPPRPPAFPSREEAELRITRARILEVGLRSAKGRGGGTEFDQLREYGVDDEVRRIDWAATARAGKAIVRTYRAERNQNVLLLLDNGRVMAGQVADVPRVEHAMDALMCLTTVATRLGDRCGLVAFDRTVRAVLPGALGSRPARSGRRGDVRPRARAGRERLPRRVHPRAGPVPPPVADRAVHRPRGAGGGGVAAPGAAAPRAPPHRARRRGPRSRRRPLGHRATRRRQPRPTAPTAATLALAERDRAIARLRGLGAIVVDAPPGQLAPQLADTYLDLKARGGL